MLSMIDLLTEHKSIASIAVVIIIYGLRWLAIRYFRKLPPSEDNTPQRWINATKNTSLFLMVIALAIIWLSELRFVALSIATFAVALVIATRDFIQCLLGSLYQAITRSFVAGDWIQIGNRAGEVISSDWLCTVLLEVDIESPSYDFTGKTLIIPNSQLMGTQVCNLNFMRRYVVHSFSIVRDDEHINLFDFKEALLSKAVEYCQPFQETGERYSGMIKNRLGLDISSNVSVRISTTNLGKNQFDLSMFCPREQAIAIEQKLMQDFLELWYAAQRDAKIKKERKEHAIDEALRTST